MNSLLERETESHQSNRQKILNAAEMLFARDGFDATSLRSITTEAGVNIALVNYYFQSKDRLIMEVLARAIRPLNEERLHLLQLATDETHPQGASLHEILDAMIRPCLDLAFDPKKQQITQLLVRSLSEEGNFIQELIEKEWRPVDIHFVEAFKKALPHVPEEQIYWRMHFTIGSMIHAASHCKDLQIFSQGLCQCNLKHVLNQLITYAAAGMQAPVDTPKPPV